MKSKGKIVWTLGAAAFVVGLAAVAWQQSDVGRASRNLNAQIAAAHREGVPIEWKDLVRYAPPVAFADNAALPYLQGFAMLDSIKAVKAVKTDRLLKDLPRNAVKPEELAQLKSALLQAGRGLEEVKAGSMRHALSFSRRWELGPSLLFPEMAKGRNAARLLILRAMLSNDPASAASDLRAAARLRAHLGSEPIILSALVGDSMEMDLHRGLRSLGSRGPAWAATLVPVLDDLGPVADARRGLAGESVMGRHLTDELAKHSGSMGYFTGAGASMPFAMRLHGLKPVRDAFESRIIEYWRKVYAALPTDPLDFRKTEAALKIPIPSEGASYALLEMVTPSLGSFGDPSAREESERRLSRTALNLWQGKLGTLPDDLFGNGRLKMKREGERWTLWSVGPDGLDDGGLERTKSGQARYDLVVSSQP